MKAFFAAPLLDFILLFLAVTTTTFTTVSSSSDDQQQCNGIPPQLDMVNYLGATLDYDVADRICCHNHRYAESKGYLEEPQVALFDRLDPTKETIFYDVVCGLPLFIAPRGRTFEEFKDESIHHGWPSFRPEEMISENVILHDDGRMESICLTHLGHNLPDSGVDRYCIDLVCIAGSPLNVSQSDLTQQFPSLVVVQDTDTTTTTTNVVTADSLLEDPSDYVSSAEQNSGKVSNKSRNVTIGVVIAVIVVLILVGGAVYYKYGSSRSKNTNKMNEDDEENNNMKNDDDNDTSNEVEEEAKTAGSGSTTD